MVNGYAKKKIDLGFKKKWEKSDKNYRKKDTKHQKLIFYRFFTLYLRVKHS